MCFVAKYSQMLDNKSSLMLTEMNLKLLPNFKAKTRSNRYLEEKKEKKDFSKGFYTYSTSQIGVGIDISARNVVLLSETFDLVNQSNDSLEFLVSFAQCGFELSVSINESLDLI